MGGIEGGGTDDGIALGMVDDGDEVFAFFFAPRGHVVVVFNGVVEGGEENCGAQGDLLFVEGVIHRDALDSDHWRDTPIGDRM